ncbi:MFS transporter [Nonomuraea sp. KC401]|uniref:MFS transporter n=1 Tax=unclassified Nonomuraea TaxID=2593643 RepID=UPI0010FF220B|nr:MULTISPECIES: MFS transporter [unclassified Nonomuraea]NBE94468.1 MFS transporter [Nonomuraea sp. K271]TLF72820.1 MFS transporter [Nonomuraea sp. KC401]
MSVDTAPVASATPAPPSPNVPLRSWLAVIAVATATFAMVTVESLPVGLLTAISGGLGVSQGLAGLTVTLPGLLAAISAPVLPILIRRLDRRLVLLSLLTVMLAATLTSALAPNFGVLLASRVFVGIAIGGFWALAASVAVRLVPERHIPRATSLAFGGATAANVLGAPAATLIGGLTDWRIAFGVVAALGALVAVALHALLPKLPATTTVSPRTLVAQLRNPAVRAAVTATFLLVGAHWAAFTFISPILQQTSGLDATLIGPAQLAFGVAGILGTVVAGSAAARDPRRALIGAGVLLAASLALFPLVGATPAGGLVLLVVWGLAFGGVPVGVQSWIFKAAPEAAEAATALNTSMFNLAIAAGAAVGGVIVSMTGTTGVLWIGAALGVVAGLAVWATGRSLTR